MNYVLGEEVIFKTLRDKARTEKMIGRVVEVHENGVTVALLYFVPKYECSVFRTFDEITKVATSVLAVQQPKPTIVEPVGDGADRKTPDEKKVYRQDDRCDAFDRSRGRE